jgi:hypothetical protein
MFFYVLQQERYEKKKRWQGEKRCYFMKGFKAG